MKIDVKALDKLVSTTYGKNGTLKVKPKSSKDLVLKEENPKTPENKGLEVKDQVSLSEPSEKNLEAYREKIKHKISKGLYSPSKNFGAETKSLISDKERRELETMP